MDSYALLIPIAILGISFDKIVSPLVSFVKFFCKITSFLLKKHKSKNPT